MLTSAGQQLSISLSLTLFLCVCVCLSVVNQGIAQIITALVYSTHVYNNVYFFFLSNIVLVTIIFFVLEVASMMGICPPGCLAL